MIPKTIHYCWFGRKPLPKDAIKCIESWRKYLPDYEIIEWNESNFDVNVIPYTAQAYATSKYAFVSDYARFKILYEHGGIYFDTDVEVIKPMYDIIDAGPFMGCELSPGETENGKFLGVNPGLGIGAFPKMVVFNQIIDLYDKLTFINPDGSYNETTIVRYVSEILNRHGLVGSTNIQDIAGLKIYPCEYFNPFNDRTGRLNITPNTHSIHWYSKTWHDHSKARIMFSRLAHRIIGTQFTSNIKNILNKLIKRI